MTSEKIAVPDWRTDAYGNVHLTMPVAELERFIGFLNRAQICQLHPVEQFPELTVDEGVMMLCRFRPEYGGSGLAILSVTEVEVDRCERGMMCSVHQWLPPGHGDCHAEAMPCNAEGHHFEELPTERTEPDGDERPEAPSGT